VAGIPPARRSAGGAAAPEYKLPLSLIFFIVFESPSLPLLDFEQIF